MHRRRIAQADDRMLRALQRCQIGPDAAIAAQDFYFVWAIDLAHRRDRFGEVGRAQFKLCCRRQCHRALSDNELTSIDPGHSYTATIWARATKPPTTAGSALAIFASGACRTTASKLLGLSPFETLAGRYERQPYQFVGPLQEFPQAAPVRYLLLTHWTSPEAAECWLASDVMMALALHLDPVFVAAHHVARFVVTAFSIAFAARSIAGEAKR